jgi:micrococcal nuclease
MMMRFRTKSLILLTCLLWITGCGSDSKTTTEPSDDYTGDYITRTALVTYVYDGDTIQVDHHEKVRYIGIDTPEIGECYYWEATLRNRELVDDRTVTLEICRDSPTDQYGRTLAHIKVDGTLVNAVLLQEGYARTMRIPPCTSRADYYEQLEREARSAGRGRWSACP